jgi:hypothetical protein
VETETLTAAVPRVKSDKLLCFLSLTKAMDAKNNKGEVPRCDKKDCKFVHKKTVGEITLKSAKIAAKAFIQDAVLRENLKAGVKGIPIDSWLKGERVQAQEGKGGKRANFTQK